ncbi:MAG: adenylosuccinate synthase [bacterium]|nr:adenylosuccinate synthase [bacterium]
MADIVIGLQWGDEAKGRFVDYIAKEYDIICRFQGGANAGHTIVTNNTKLVLHLLPSGIIRPEKKNLITAGVLIDPEVFKEEVAEISKLTGSLEGRLYVDERATIVLPFHKEEDALEEESKGGIGSTKRGIAYAYRDLYQRIGIRVGDLFHDKTLAKKVKNITDFNNQIIAARFGHPPFDYKRILEDLKEFARFIKPFIVDGFEFIHKMEKEGKKILFEGAQGSLLDIIYGTYPYVTSSHTISSGALVFSGLPPQRIDKVYGVFKAYTTRVGKGPFPTEIKGGKEELIRDKGQEFGATTGRPRRCGWLDLVIIKYSILLNGVTNLVMTKLDVLSGIEHIKVAIRYKKDGELIELPPPMSEDFESVEPIYEELSGFELSTREERYDELPLNAKKYIEFIESQLGLSIDYISVGPEREKLIKRNP